MHDATFWLMVVQGIATTVLGALISFVGWLVKRNISENDRRHTENGNRIDDLAHSSARRDTVDDLAERLRDLERDTVSKEEYVRAISVSRIRQDEILREISELKGQNRMGVEIGAAIAAALKREPS